MGRGRRRVVGEDKLQLEAGRATPAPLTSALLREAAGLEKGSASPNGGHIGTITREQLRRIAEIKLPDLNAASIEGAMKTVEGTARSMGIRVSG